MSVVFALFSPRPRRGTLRCAVPAPRKPGVYIHVHPLGGVKLCFTESTAEPMCPGRHSRAAVACFGVRSAMENSLARCRQRLIEIGEEVLDVLDAYRQANGLRSHADVALLIRRELAVRGGGGMAGE